MTEISNSVAARALRGDEKEQALLAAAFETFATYGFRRSSMEDIARAAGMSRSALYLYFKNKEDVFKALVEYHFAMAKTRVQEALNFDEPIAHVIAKALAAYDGLEIEAIMRSPHGAELLDTKTSTSSDIASQGEQEIRDMIANWLAKADAQGRVSLENFGGNPTEIAQTILAAKVGLKSNWQSYDDYVRGRQQLASMIGRGLSD